MDTIKVVCWIIYKDNKIFLCKRKSNKSLGWYWEFPWWKIEYNENNSDALYRELMEEIDMKVKNLSYFDTVIHSYEKIKVELIAYECEYIESSFTLIDHDIFEWVSIEDLLKYNLAAADIPIAKKLIYKNIM